MIIGNKQSKIRPHIATAAEKGEYAREIEKQYPGFADENIKLTTVVRILTGLRVMYGVFFLYMAVMYGLEWEQGVLIVVGAAFFWLWYSWMLRMGRMLAWLMLMFRGIGIVQSGSMMLSMTLWLPFPLIFTLVLPIVLEFVEAVFCIYVLFNNTASQTIRLNQQMDRNLIANAVPKAKLEENAEYKNPYNEELQKKEDFDEGTSSDNEK